MKLRSRFVAALLALAGLLTFSVQGAWAAPCTANVEVGSTSISAEPASHASSCIAGAAAIRGGNANPADHGGSGAPHCPSMPTGVTGGCGAMLALPADSSPPLASLLPEAQISPRAARIHELLLAGAFFRPPIS